jgi:nucleoside-diphosphate-sugar epimerase
MAGNGIDLCVESDLPLNTVLVTGANGFIGSHLIRYLMDSGFDTRAYSRKEFETDKTAINCKTKWIRGELDSQDRLKEACEGVDAVIHCAGLASSGGSELETLLKYNLGGTKNAFYAASNSHVKKFLYLSSLHASLPSVTSYSESKYAAEQFLCSHEAVNQNTQIFIVRLANVYGPGMKGSLLALVQYASLGWLPSLSNLGGMLSLISIKDLCRSIIMLLDDPYPKHVYKYSLADGQEYSFERLEEVIYRELGRRRPAWAIPSAAFRLIAAGARFANYTGLKNNQFGRRLKYDFIHERSYHDNAFPRLMMADMTTLENELPEIIASMGLKKVVPKK